MSDSRKCPRCGSALAADVPDGLCPACLLSAGLVADDPTSAPPGTGDGTVEATERASIHDPLPNIPRFHLIAAIGEGGMGVVYKAEQRSPVKRIVALKLIKLGMDTKQVIARFESERQALAMLNHPNVAAVYEAGATETGRPYFVMEYVPGEPITQFCDRHSYTTKQRLELFIQACEAIQHAHQKAIIHRDIKPSNILVMLECDKPVVKVIDFGVAKATAQRLTERTMFTEQGQLIGTPEYMSPEQAEMTASDVDTRADIYSLGVVLYELLSGTLPFDGETLRKAAFGEIQRIIREVDAPRPSTRFFDSGTSDQIAQHRRTQVAALQHELQSDLEWIPLTALRKDRAQRYRTANEMADDIRNYLADRPLMAGPESARYRLKKFLRRNKGAVGAVAAILFALLVGLSFAPLAAAVPISLALAAGMVGTTVALLRARRAEATALAALNESDRQRREAERQKAEAQAASANLQAVNEFLTEDLLGSANPNVAQGREITVREVLETAGAAVAEKFKDRPLVEASVRQAIADAYNVMARDEMGIPHARAALETRRLVLGDDHIDTLRSMNTLALMLSWRYTDSKLMAEAESLCREALERSRRMLGADDYQTLTCLNNLTYNLWLQNKMIEAEPLCREALERCRRVLGDDHPQTLQALHGLAVLLQWTGRPSEAEPLLREALEGRRRVLGHDHIRTMLTLDNMAGLARLLGNLEFAEALLKELVETERRVLGADHPYTLAALGRLVNVLRERGKLDEAENVGRAVLAKSPSTSSVNTTADTGGAGPAALTVREVLDKAAATVGEKFNGRPLVEASIRQALASAYANAARDDLGMQHAQIALDLRRQLLGEDHIDTLRTMQTMGLILGWNYTEAESMDKSKALFRDALERSRRTVGDDHPDTLVFLNRLCFHLRVEDRMDEAEPLCREALERCQRVLGADHPETIAAIHGMGNLLRVQGKLAEAEPFIREALQRRRRVIGSDQIETISSIYEMASLLKTQGKIAEAEPLFLELLERERRILGDDHPYSIAGIGMAASVLRLQGKLIEAEKLCRDVLMANPAATTDEHACTPEPASAANPIGPKNGGAAMALHELAITLQAEGKLAEAEQCYQRALTMRRSLYGLSHKEVAETLMHFAGLLRSCNRAVDAVKLYREALAIRRNLPLPPQEDLARDAKQDLMLTLTALSDLLRSQAISASREGTHPHPVELTEAEALIEECQTLRRASAKLPALNQRQTPDLPGSANPEVAKRWETTVRELVDQAAATAGEKFKDQPVVEASVRQVMADVYQVLGRPDLGLPQATRALELRRRFLGNDHIDTFRSMMTLAYLHLWRSNFVETEVLVREVSERSHHALGEDNPDALFYLNALCQVLMFEKKLDESEPLCRMALERCRRALGDDHPNTINATGNLAGVMRAQGKLLEAEQLFGEFLAGRRRVMGDDHPLTLLALEDMASVLQAQGKLAAAETHYRELVDRNRRVFGDDHRFSVESFGFLTNVLRAQGRTSEVEKLCREFLAIERRAPGAEHPRAPGAEQPRAPESVSTVASLDQRPDGSEFVPLYREALDWRRAGPKNTMVAMVLHELATLLWSEQKLVEAEQMYREALEVPRSSDPKSWTVSNTLICLAELLQSQKRYADAEPYLLDAYEQLQANPGLPPQVAHDLDPLNRIISLYNAWGQRDKAAEWRAKRPITATTTSAPLGSPGVLGD